MIRIIFGVLFVISGLSFITKPGDNIILSMLIGVGIGAALIWSGYKSLQRKKEAKESVECMKASVEGEPIKTFSFRATGTTHNARFSNGTRSDAIAASKIGDVCTFKEYEWEGAPAFAVINARTGGEVAVVPAGKVATVSKMLYEYKTLTTIIGIDTFEWNDDMCYGCDVQVACYPK